MWMLILLIVLGLVLLKKGADWFVQGSSDLARKLRVSELAVGLTVVAFGTSSPEMVVNGFASVKGNYDIVYGNIIGSNTFNLFLILSIVGIITPVMVKSSTAWKEIPFSLAALAALFLLANDRLLLQSDTSRLSRLDGLILLACFSLFLFYVFTQLKNDPYAPEVTGKPAGNWRILLLILAGLAGLVGGGRLVLDNAVKIATQLGLSERVIGMTIVAAGTSFPELATSVIAALRKNVDIAVGNIIGSNLFNVLLIIPFTALIRPLPYNAGFNADIAFVAAGTVLLFLAMYTGRRMRIDRWEAFVLLASYIVYIAFMLK